MFQSQRGKEPQFATCTSPITHLICLQKFCISIVFNFSWDSCNSQEKWKTKGMQNLCGGGGLGQIRCIMGDVQAADTLLSGTDTHITHYWGYSLPPPPVIRCIYQSSLDSDIFLNFRPRLHGSTQIFKRAKKNLQRSTFPLHETRAEPCKVFDYDKQNFNL